MAECFPRYNEFFSEECINAQRFPVLNSYADASEFVCHLEVSFFKEPVEGATLRHIDGVHRRVTQTENFTSFEADNIPW